MRSCFLPAILLGWAGGDPAAAQPPAPPNPAANAAIQYWQAFGLLPALDKDQEKILREWAKTPLDAAAAKLIEQSKSSLQYLHRGAELPRCDWGLDYEDGIGLLLPHAPKARALGALAALRARQEFGRGDLKAGWADVTALFALARHVETDPLMIDQLIGYAIEGMAIQAAAPYLPDSKAELATVTTVLDRLPSGATFDKMLQIERRTCSDWLIGELKAADKNEPGSWRAHWKSLFPAGEGGGPAPKMPPVATLDEAVKMLEGLAPLYDELERLTKLPWTEFDAGYTAFIKKAQTANPSAVALLPAMDHMVAAKRRADARFALFKAAVAVVRGGPDKLADIRDPFGDGPFAYKMADGGFELRSKLLFKSRPVTLAVGKK
ncbi:MAG TPA: hypothetical protein VGJ05_18695 [Fimbriiglobus sp.]|jgi:hypothetical protein